MCWTQTGVLLRLILWFYCAYVLVNTTSTSLRSTCQNLRSVDLKIKKLAGYLPIIFGPFSMYNLNLTWKLYFQVIAIYLFHFFLMHYYFLLVLEFLLGLWGQKRWRENGSPVKLTSIAESLTLEWQHVFNIKLLIKMNRDS